MVELLSDAVVFTRGPFLPVTRAIGLDMRGASYPSKTGVAIGAALDFSLFGLGGTSLAA